MPKYIDKDKLLNGIECIDISDCTDIDDIFVEVERTIDEQPTADVIGVKQGRWIILKSEDEYEHHYCSECNKDAIAEYETDDIYDENEEGDMVYIANITTGIKEHLTNFCPNCGAKMDRKDGKNNAE